MRIALFLLAAALWGADPNVRVQLVTGGHPHDISFYGVFEGDRDFTINVNPHPSAFQSDFRKDVDVLVLYDMADMDGERERQHLREFLDAGKGMVVLHHAVIDNQHWPWWYEDVVGGRYLLKPEDGQRASTYQHDVAMRVRPVEKHPVTEGIGEFAIVDEVYNYMWVSPRSRVLLEADKPEGPKAVAWIAPWPKSRVVAIQLGHGREAHENPAYRKLVRNAILWAAGRM
ncbi:MAG: ThuA domain-containing protein [Acidobacteria bacterium]|nr:ThuA domain-containing protein [Acidobacteriota bacterium]